MKLRSFVLVVIAASTALAVAQNGGNKANWKLMERYSNATLGRFVYSTTVNPNFINESDEFWYVWNDSKGKRFMHVDPKAKKKERAFDHDKLAAALTELGKKPVVGNQLPFNSISFNKEATAITFVVERQNYEWNLKDEALKKIEPPAGQATPGPGAGGGGGGGGFQGGGQGQANRPTFNTAPDELAFVYTQGYNLYYGEKAKKEDEPDKVEGTEKLTTDGEQFYEFRNVNYSTYTLGDKQEVKRSVGANWSKDSKAFTVSRSDARKVSDLFVINSLSNPRPTVETYKYQMPGEENVQQTEIYLFTRDDKKVRRVPAEKWKDQTVSNVHWVGKDATRLRFSRRDRLQRNQELCEYDPATNEVTVVLSESTENAFIETQATRYLEEDNLGDIVWWSERSGWGHYYLYSHDGKLKNPITAGAWRAESVLEVDREDKKLYFSAVGKEDEDLYNSHHYVVGLDGKGMKLLDAGDADHTFSLSKSKDFGVDRYSRVDMPPKSCVRDKNGNVVMELEDMDLSRLSETGWRAPERFVVKAADGVTDILGNMWKPFDFDPHKKYPIILSIYPGPQTEQVTQTFSATGSNQELAQLGFIVIQIGNRGGTPHRSNAYHSYGYYNLRDYGLADKKAGVEQLALKYPWIDIDRVGIYGHSGGGFMTAAALLLPPFNDFFKVGVSSAGNHDNNIYNANWSEQHHGLRVAQAQQQQQQQGGTGGAGRGGRGGGGGGGEPDQDDWDGLIGLVDQQQGGGTQQGTQQQTQTQEKFEIKVPTNVEIAANLKGKLLLVHGDIDNNVHPGNTIRLVDALIKANKRFDFMVMPGQRHGFGPLSGYFNQMLKEYFATHLLGDDYTRSADMNNKGG